MDRFVCSRWLAYVLLALCGGLLIGACGDRSAVSTATAAPTVVPTADVRTAVQTADGAHRLFLQALRDNDLAALQAVIDPATAPAMAAQFLANKTAIYQGGDPRLGIRIRVEDKGIKPFGTQQVRGYSLWTYEKAQECWYTTFVQTATGTWQQINFYRTDGSACGL
jgi:hypothetical protein